MVQSWDDVHNVLSISNIAGEFVDGQRVTGTRSNAHFILLNYDPQKEHIRDDSYDNYIIENQANNVVNLAENNPFGSI